ncbi:sialate O-acetylesterase [Mucilaginibacter sp. BJC16-A38]|uniref:sialate O-acetylesterase n=1 Tax=Mucilaginibacter phenanthrenivorans TaxID=1234842 RepID=UPI002157F079|nr:sialate O-acetylesterase [Mucilaginibacter phenanthrenivorans]MCR8556035.1 sialate O-acetylesterase [Mucilaginibacter phenanthrenivorans]
MKFLTITLAAIFAASAVYAQLSTSKLFGDHMVLQRNHNIPVWGRTGKKAKVIIDLNNQHIVVKADEQGNWTATLASMKEGGPYTMKISSGKESISYSDIMLGEVWLCSGQSNMEFQLKNAYGYKAEQKVASQVAVRQFHVQNKISLTPEKDVTGQWILASANTIGDFTAVGYFYAKKLSQTLHVTVGIINSSWGGTEAEDWISRETIVASPDFKALVPDLPQNADQLSQRSDKLLKRWAYHNGPVVNFTAEDLATKPGYFFDTWQHAYAPGSWEWNGRLYSYRGLGFMQRTLSLDSSYSSVGSVISLGQTDADMDIYINGKLINKGALPTNYQLSLPAGTWKTGMNSLLINFQSAQKNPTWFGTGLNGTGANDLNIRFADTTINIADGNWHVMPDLSKPYHFDFLPNNTAFDLYNGMINPLIPYALAGVIWYQGESNAERAFQYRSVFQMLINDWRGRWKEQLPFLFVQLSSFGTSQNSNLGSNWAELREAQNMALQLPNTGVAVTTDIGDPFNIHPKDKADVGYRLAATSLTQVYHQPGFFASPLFVSADFSGGSALVSFSNAENGLMAKDQYGYVKGFELAGADHKFYYAQAVITDKNKVKVWCSAVPNPVAVRYGWTNAPVDANLFNIQGFPVSPFRSDTWDGVTLGHKFE